MVDELILKTKWETVIYGKQTFKETIYLCLLVCSLKHCPYYIIFYGAFPISCLCVICHWFIYVYAFLIDSHQFIDHCFMRHQTLTTDAFNIHLKCFDLIVRYSLTLLFICAFREPILPCKNMMTKKLLKENTKRSGKKILN